MSGRYRTGSVGYVPGLDTAGSGRVFGMPEGAPEEDSSRRQVGPGGSGSDGAGGGVEAEFVGQRGDLGSAG